jgi:hypothetical protein
MAKTPTAAYAQSPKTASAVVTAALGSITTDAPTGTVLLMTAGTEGAVVTRLSAMPRATVTASSLVLFVSNDGGTTMRLKDSALMAAQTVDTTHAIAQTTFPTYADTTPLRLAAGDKLYVGSQVALASGIVFCAEYTDF